MTEAPTDSHGPSASASNRRSLILLTVGALVGIGLAASGAFSPASFDDLPDDAIARINDRTIPADAYLRARDMLANDKRNPMSERDRQHVLRRLVEEELLIQRGEDIGLVASDPGVRKAIAAAMIQSIVAESESEQPSRELLEDFYESNLGYFTPPGFVHVRQVEVRPREGEPAAEREDRSRLAREALESGMAAVRVEERFGDPVFLPIPDAPLPTHKLRQYIGPTLGEKVARQEIGSVSEIRDADSGAYRLLQLVAAEPGQAPAFADSTEQVEVAYRRDAADRALRDYLDFLWRDADVRFAPGAPLP